MGLSEKYGSWAFVAGGSEGLGGAWCDRLAAEGFNVVVSGRHIETIKAKSDELKAKYNVETRELVVDLGGLDAYKEVIEKLSDLEIGFFVYNAGISDNRFFPERDIETELWRLNVNSRTLLALSIYFSRQMVERKKGAMVLTSSGAGVCGSPYLQTYAATKAYNLNLAEGLWSELGDFGVDVISPIVGATISQTLKVPAGTPGIQTAEEVVEETLEHLGKVPGFICSKIYDMFKENYVIDERIRVIEHIKHEVHNPEVTDFFTKNDQSSYVQKLMEKSLEEGTVKK